MAFNPDTDISSLTGKVVIVTGGTDGLGRESVRQLSLHSPARIYLAGRNGEKAQGVLEDINQRHPDHAPITFLEMDMSSLASTKRAATKFLAENDRLDILMCNAGCMGQPNVTEDGYELAFGVNHLAHALLIQMLLPVLQRTASIPGNDVRVVNLSSIGERMAPKIYTFDTVTTDLRQMSMMARYGQSKLANIHYTSMLAKKYPEILFVSVHPGQVTTNMQKNFLAGQSAIVVRLIKTIVPLFLKVDTVEDGAKNQLWAATTKRSAIENGAFYHPVGVHGKGSARSQDMSMAEALWTWTETRLQPYIDEEKFDHTTSIFTKAAMVNGYGGASVVTQEVHV